MSRLLTLLDFHVTIPEPMAPITSKTKPTNRRVGVEKVSLNSIRKLPKATEPMLNRKLREVKSDFTDR